MYKHYKGHRLLFIISDEKILGKVLINIDQPDALKWDLMADRDQKAFSYSKYHAEVLLNE
jgi:hypothetical protein